MYSKHDSYENFREFYLELAMQQGQNGVVDIACGTGAVLLYLAQNGIDVDGTDISHAMVSVSRNKARKLGLELNIVQANMTDFSSDRKYSLGIIARSGFMHLLTPESQREALINIRKCLLPGGILTLNTFDPNPIFQAAQMKTRVDDYSYRLEYTNRDGKREKIYDAITYDPKTQWMYGNWKFETLDDGVTIDERIRPLKMRQTYKQEMHYLAEICGYEVVKIYGNYFKSEEYTGRFIWVLRKTG